MSSLAKAVPFVILFTLLVAVSSVSASWRPAGVPLCTAADGQQAPQITSDGEGGAIVTWLDAHLDNNGIGIQRVNSSGAVQWTANGVPVCATEGFEGYPQIISDGAGGAIVTWHEDRSGNLDIYAQRVSASGAVEWAENGVPVCSAEGFQGYPQITSDGAGGAIVTWYDFRSGNADIYAQRVNASGTVQWAADGVPLCTATGDQFSPKITSDDAGGAIITWDDSRSGITWDVYAQRVNASGTVQWVANGKAICTATGDQESSQITSDGAGGAIVTWHDGRGANYDIYVQRVNSSGTVQWAANGVALCTATGDQGYPQIASDGASGAIVTWWDYRSGSQVDIYSQRVNASGAVQWTTNGVALCTAPGDQNSPTIISDGAGGAIVTWNDFRSAKYDAYAQRVNASGAVQWTTNGVALCTATGDQIHPAIVSDGAGGAIVTWDDHRGSTSDIYAQLIVGSGQVPTAPPSISSIQDVPADQGGWARITIDRSTLDDALESSSPVSLYNVWQRIDDVALLALVAQRNNSEMNAAPTNEAPLRRSVDALSVSNWPLKELSGRYFVQSKELLEAAAFPPGTWELLGSFAACQQDSYIYRASTLADSTASGIPYSVYIVSAHTTRPSVWYLSDPDSGYSVDNIAPAEPRNLAGHINNVPVGLGLTWRRNTEADLSHYAIYRGESADFIPNPENPIATPPDTMYFDSGYRWIDRFYYKVSAVDVHGNESVCALLAPEDVTGNDTPKAPDASYLAQNYPNPFNPTTRIAFGLSAPGHVSLRIYDAAGRLVRALVNEERHAANYEESWDGRDSNGRSVASGIYFYKLAAGSFEETRKMALLR